jgi:hypothetical protein
MNPLLFAQEITSAFLSFFDRWGNAASVIGLGITLVGFAATLWSVWRIKEATRRAVIKIGMQLLSVETTILLRLIAEARDAGRDKLWARAIDRCQQARLIAVTLCRSPHLLKDEREALRKADDDLRIVVQYIENNRLTSHTAAPNLPDAKKRAMDRMVTMLGGIQGRLQATAMEV